MIVHGTTPSLFMKCFVFATSGTQQSNVNKTFFFFSALYEEKAANGRNDPNIFFSWRKKSLLDKM